MGMTERQGGTDVRTNTTAAVAAGEGYLITRAQMVHVGTDVRLFLVLAQATGRLTCFLMPRFPPRRLGECAQRPAPQGTSSGNR